MKCIAFPIRDGRASALGMDNLSHCFYEVSSRRWKPREPAVMLETICAKPQAQLIGTISTVVITTNHTLAPYSSYAFRVRKP